MDNLENFQYLLIALIFAWSGFVRSGLGFGGALLSLPFLLLVDDRPLVYLPLIAVHLLFFASITVIQNHYKQKHSMQIEVSGSTVNWLYLRRALAIMIVPKLVGVFGLLTLPATIMSRIIFIIVIAYSLSYVFNRPFRSQNKWLDAMFLMLGGYISGTSLIGAPLIVAVFSTHVAKHQLRDTLFVLWFILVVIKMTAFVYTGVDLQLENHLWLLPCAAVGHILGLRFHRALLNTDTVFFYRILGGVLLAVSIIGLWQAA